MLKTVEIHIGETLIDGGKVRVQYEDIKATDYEAQKAVLATLRSISWRSNEPLEIECQSPRPGWIPAMVVLQSADKIFLDGKVIKDRFGNENEDINS